MDSFPDTAFDSSLMPDVAGAGLPHDRASRMAARRAFVQMKLLFLRATGVLEDRKGQWLRHQVRVANDPLDLWLLRGPVLRALGEADERHLRSELYRGLDQIFPQAFGFDDGSTLPPTIPAPWEAMAGSSPSYIR